MELLTPQHWYNTSSEAPAGSVLTGHGFNITCSTPHHYPGGSFQLRLIRSNGTLRQSLPALSTSVTFTFPSAQRSDEGYYYCLYRVQLGGRTFVSRESQPLPIAVKGTAQIYGPRHRTKPPVLLCPDPDPLLSAMMVSWLVSVLTLLVTVVMVVVMVKVLRNKEKKPCELERETRTCQSLLCVHGEPRSDLCFGVLNVSPHRCGQHLRCLVSQQMMTLKGNKRLFLCAVVSYRNVNTWLNASDFLLPAGPNLG